MQAMLDEEIPFSQSSTTLFELNVVNYLLISVEFYALKVKHNCLLDLRI